MGKSRVILNGTVVAEHFGGYLPIHAEVTGVLKPGENLLEVWCDNSDDPTYPPGKPQAALDFAYFGGIYRDAYLIETGDAYVTDTDRGGVRITTNRGADGIWTVSAEVTLGGAPFRRKKIFRFMIRYVCPVFVMIILVSSVAEAFGWIQF